MVSCQIIGEELLLGEESKNIIVESNHLISLECSWDTFKEKMNIMNTSLENCINELNTITFFKGLSINKLIDIAKNIAIEKHEKNTKIIKKGDKVEFIYFIKNGTVIPDFAFIEVFGINYKYKLFLSFLKNTLFHNKHFKFLMENNALKDIIKIFSLQEYKNNDMLSSELPDDIQKK